MSLKYRLHGKSSTLGSQCDTMRGIRAFTLTELLVSILIMAILGVLIAIGIGTVRQSADRSSALSTMRNMGSLLQLYIVDNGQLPGPLWANHAPFIRNNPTVLTDRLIPYLTSNGNQLETGQLVRELASKPWMDWYENRPSGAALYPFAYHIRIPPIQIDGEDYFIWGYPSTLPAHGSPDNAPGQANFNRLQSGLNSSNTWIMRDYVDSLRRNDGPPVGYIGDGHVILYLDTSVRWVE